MIEPDSRNDTIIQHKNNIQFLKNLDLSTAEPTSFHHHPSHFKLLVIFSSSSSSSSITITLVFSKFSSFLSKSKHTVRASSRERLRKAIESWLLDKSFGSLKASFTLSLEYSQSAFTQRFCRNVVIDIRDRKFLHSLICLPLIGQGVILGLDWLSRNRVFLDCYHKTAMVVSRGLAGIPTVAIECYLNSAKVSSPVSNDEGFVLLMASSVELEQDLAQIPVVREYPSGGHSTLPSGMGSRVFYRPCARSWPGVSGTLPHVSPRTTRIEDSTRGADGEELHSPECFTLGSSGLVGEEERRKYEALCGL
ncbi:hypothetical protein PIB30_030425 [Stylosanthes scabra]|uniref:Uncharacterized protein n=1 Tax=Stylosanthes scabra TaxID=79078 RepID=A0ABU6QCB2_9FABA|nr:hypothetical protein [Stylosanthes scabra]